MAAVGGHVRLEGGEHLRVTLDRPPANALSGGLMIELEQACEAVMESNPRVVVLASAQPMFMAGADLAMLNQGWSSLSGVIARFQRLVSAWAALPMPTIGLINGHALGAGCELSLACDWRIMARGSARIGLPEVRRGLIAAGSGIQRTARLVGRARALDLNMRGRMLDADEAAAIGLVSEACDPEELDARGEALARELLGLPFHTLVAIKRAITEGLETDFTSALAIEQREMVALGDTADTREGVAAFLEKREPVWVHR